jgi:HEAT repeat protein
LARRETIKRWILTLLCRRIAVAGYLALALLACGQPSPDPLFEQLQSRDAAERLKAANALLVYDFDEVVPLLIREYGSDYIRVRFEVVKLLGRTKDPRGVPVLIEALGDKSSNVAQAAAWGLGQVRAPEALGPLLGYVHDGSKGMRGQVFRSLGTCHSFAREPALSDSARREIVFALRDPDEETRMQALLGIHEFGYAGSVEDVIRMSRDASAKVRHVAVQALGHIAAGSAPEAVKVGPGLRVSIVEALIAALDDAAYQSIRTKAVKALEAIADPASLPHLQRLHDSGSEEDRREAGRVIEKLAAAAQQQG